MSRRMRIEWGRSRSRNEEGDKLERKRENVKGKEDQ